MSEPIKHPPQAGGDPAAEVVVRNDKVIIADSELPEPPRKGRRVRERVAPRAATNGEIGVCVDVDRTRQMARVVGRTAVAGSTQIPATVDDPEQRIVESRCKVAGGHEWLRGGHAGSMGRLRPARADRRPASWDQARRSSDVGDRTEPLRHLAKAKLISTVENVVDEDDGAP
jgi:hypothetical protein